MSRDGSVELEFGDGEYRFRLGIGQARELQEKLDAGPTLLARRGLAGEMWPADAALVVRLGLIGGGMDIDSARKLARRYAEDPETAYPWAKLSMLAGSILAVAVYGVEDEQPGKPDAEAGKRPTRSRAKKSASPGSTETAP